ncbi:MAG TPA: hypothetical protein PKK43_03620 [Spirochaetota bacterium]|nr:hypothetical protein [Spirochaetota bacterium]
MASKQIIFMTAGEMTARNNLFESQVRKPAGFYRKSGYNVSIISVEPFLKVLRNRMKGKRIPYESGEVRQIRFNSLLQTRKMYSYIFIDFLSARVAKRILRAGVVDRGSAVICRSYIAASVALQLKKKMNADLTVVFDTRSILSNEIPLTNGVWGVLLFGFLKKWEYRLMREADATLVTTGRGAEYFMLDTGIGDTIHHVPISGFDVKKSYKPDFKKRWQNREVAFIGSLEFWHAEDAIRNVLGEIASDIGGSAKIITGSPDRKWGIPQYSVRHSEIMKEYEGLVAIIVPGSEQTDDYFRAQKNSINIFSTKAAEAFSVGLPVIANESIKDLCDFIREHDCGVIYGYREGKLVFLNCDASDLGKEKFWKEKTSCAAKAGVVFRQESVVKRQLQIIRKLNG